MKKLWLVSREVMADSVEQALVSRGKVYSIQLAVDARQPENKDALKRKPGFKKK